MIAKLRQRLTYSNVMATVAVFIALGGAAIASIPGSGGVIKACYAKSGGALRAIDSKKSCSKKHERTLRWSQQGPRGLQGVQGFQGQPGLNGASAGLSTAVATKTFTATGGEQTIATLNLPAGNWMIFAKLWMNNTGASGVSPNCFLRTEGAFDETDVNSGVNADASWALNLPHTFASPGAATLTCDVFGHSGMTAYNARISAVQVQTLS
jgi:hypothetical protein